MFAQNGKEARKVAKFALVGLLNTGVDFAVFVMLVYGFQVPSVWAQLVSYAPGVVNSYFWNRLWTFRAAGSGTWREFARFATLNIVSFAAATAVLLGLEQRFGWVPAAAKAASVAASLAINYAGSRWWVFRVRDRADDLF